MGQRCLRVCVLWFLRVCRGSKKELCRCARMDRHKCWNREWEWKETNEAYSRSSSFVPFSVIYRVSTCFSFLSPRMLISMTRPKKLFSPSESFSFSASLPTTPPPLYSPNSPSLLFQEKRATISSFTSSCTKSLDAVVEQYSPSSIYAPPLPTANAQPIPVNFTLPTRTSNAYGFRPNAGSYPPGSPSSYAPSYSYSQSRSPSPSARTFGTSLPSSPSDEGFVELGSEAGDLDSDAPRAI